MIESIVVRYVVVVYLLVDVDGFLRSGAVKVGVGVGCWSVDVIVAGAVRRDNVVATSDVVVFVVVAVLVIASIVGGGSGSSNADRKL